jgi:hypothetical protein
MTPSIASSLRRRWCVRAVYAQPLVWLAALGWNTPADALQPTPPEAAASAAPAPAEATPSAGTPPIEAAPSAEAAPQTAAERQALEAELAAALGPPAPAPAAAAPSAAGAPSSVRLIDIALDLLGAAGLSTAREDDLRSLEAGGHDPKNQGFTLQNVELTLAGVVDPFFRGDAHIVMLIDERGETVVELEEAYLTTLDLPFNLQLQAGQFFTEFGRLNPTHPHSWDFVDQPVVNSRLFGPDGLRSPGLQLSWLAPLPFFLELVLSAQNAQGETVTSFRSVPEETFAGRTLGDGEVRGLEDLLYLARARTSLDVAEDVSVVGGLSALFGPNASASDARTRILGADLYAKWRPLANNRGWPFVAWQTELMWRTYDAGQVLGEAGAVEPATRLDDVGWYTQLLWGFARPWVVGVRFEHAAGESAEFPLPDGSYATSLDPMRDDRERYTAVLSHYPSEFSKLRLQYNYDRAQFIDEPVHSAFLQFEILFGAHGAHQF